MPEGFSIYTDAEEPADVSPVARLTGHLRFVHTAHVREAALT